MGSSALAQSSNRRFQLNHNKGITRCPKSGCRSVVLSDTFTATLKMKRVMSVDSDCAVSSVEEHYLDTVGVSGSNPLSRTISTQLRTSPTCGQSYSSAQWELLKSIRVLLETHTLRTRLSDSLRFCGAQTGYLRSKGRMTP